MTIPSQQARIRGGLLERDNGNGSVMRCLPVAMVVASHEKAIRRVSKIW